ncbi:MAG: hypothetical protein M1831_005476 [Alyxoria varia]|nr:MAG: hypothetical protein M1831_005476 [Alyxoria varia]
MFSITTNSGASARGVKRKGPSQSSQPNPRKRRMVNLQDARAIANQTAGKAFGDGEVDVDKFVRSREFEIKALEDGMKNAKQLLAHRAFQNVPRDLRRRTASHDVKRVPKRLRAKAKREMAEDNTPTTAKRLRTLTSNSKAAKRAAEKEPEVAKIQPIKTRGPRVKENRLQNPPRPGTKFRKRQVQKSWLPTHIFHTKRAHMTPPKEPLWRMAIPISPTEKTYRSFHRANNSRGGVIWDMSYIATIGLRGTDTSMQRLFDALGVFTPGNAPANMKRWKSGKRIWHGWLFERDKGSANCIAPASILLGKCRLDHDASSVSSDEKFVSNVPRKALVRVHPSAFLQVWNKILEFAKLQKPQVVAEDLRFEIGSIKLAGPSSCEALVQVLKPVESVEGQAPTSNMTTHHLKILGSITNVAVLPKGAVITTDVVDPRLHVDLNISGAQGDCDPSKFQKDTLGLLSDWPPDNITTRAHLFDKSKRCAATRQLPSQKSIQRRKALAGGGNIVSVEDDDPHIPIITYADSNETGSLTLLMPRGCVLTVWYSLLYRPLPSGSRLQFGGLEQTRQQAFETDIPWFPADFPGAKAGMEWEYRERQKRKQQWERRPKGRRVEWQNLPLGPNQKGELGQGWACDWAWLATHGERSEGDVSLRHVTGTQAMELLKTENKDKAAGSERSLTTVRIRLLGKSAPSACARVYRLPTASQELRQSWLSLIPSASSHRTLPQKATNGSRSKDSKASAMGRGSKSFNAALSGPAPPKPGDLDYPCVPGRDDLVGFVTTGNFNLADGQGTAIGSLMLERLKENEQQNVTPETKTCIVRDAGQSHGRLARWSLL